MSLSLFVTVVLLCPLSVKSTCEYQTREEMHYQNRNKHPSCIKEPVSQPVWMSRASELWNDLENEYSVFYVGERRQKRATLSEISENTTDVLTDVLNLANRLYIITNGGDMTQLSSTVSTFTSLISNVQNVGESESNRSLADVDFNSTNRLSKQIFNR